MARLNNARNNHITRWVIPAASRLLIEGACKGASTQLLEKVAHIEMGQSPPGESYNEDGAGYPFIGGPADLGLKYPEIKRWTTAASKLCQDGDIIVCIRATIGEPRWSDGTYCIGRGVAAIRTASKELDNSFLFRIIQGNEDHLRNLGTGTTFKTISKAHLASIEVPLIPISEQKAIGAFLEWLEINSNDSLSIANAPTLPEKLAEQRRIVGRIEELAGKVEEARRLRVAAAGEAGLLLQSAKQTLFDPEDMQTQHWTEYALGDIAEIRSGVTLGRILSGSTIKLPYLRVANVQDGYLDLEEIKEVEIRETEFDKWQLERGDILLTEGGDWDKLGRGTVWEEEIPNCIHQNHIFRLRVDQTVFDPYFLLALISSPYGKTYFQGASKQTTNLASINQRQLKAFTVYKPSYERQQQIVSYLQDLQSKLAKLREMQELTQTELDALIPAILDKAFKGEL